MLLPSTTRFALLLSLSGTLQAQATVDPNLIFSLLAEQSRTAFTVQGAGARAIGTGGAFIAIADDGTAVSFNPAGLAQLLKPEFSMVGQSLNRRQDFARFNSQDTAIEDSVTSDTRVSPQFLSFAMPWKQNGLNRVVQFSYQRIFDMGYKSDRTFNLRVNGKPSSLEQAVNQRGGVNLWSLGFGAEVTPRLLLGGSVNVWRGSWAFNSGSQLADASGSPISDLSLQQDNHYRGFNWNLGTIWRSKYLNLGAVYRSGFNADYGFSNTLITDNYVDQNPPHVSQIPSTNFQIQWPETLGAGVGIHLHPRWLVTTDWTKIRWSKATILSSDPAYDGRNFFDLRFNTQTADITDFHAGTEWIAFLGDRVVIPLRAGVFREPQPLVDRRTGEQRVYHGWTAGFGIKSGSFTMDLAYKDSISHRQVSRLTLSPASGTSTTSTIGEENLDERRVYMSLIWQINPEAAKKVLGWIFVGD